MRFSSFLGTHRKATLGSLLRARSSLRGLGALGDVDCERDLLQRLAAQFFQSLPTGGSTDRALAARAFTSAYLASSAYPGRLPRGAALLTVIKGFMEGYLDSVSLSDFTATLRPTAVTQEALDEWAASNPVTEVAPISPTQAEASMLLCRTSASTLTAEARAAATRAREAQARADVAAANADVTTAGTAEARAVADAAAAALVTAVAARVAAGAAWTPGAPAIPATPTPATSFLNSNRTNISPELLERTRTAILNPRSGDVPLTPPPVEEETSYLPYIAAGGLLIIAAVIFVGKRKDAAPSNSATV